MYNTSRIELDILSSKKIKFFFKENIFLLFLGTVFVFFMYRTRILFSNIGIDTNSYIVDGGKEEWFKVYIQRGRWGDLLLDKLFLQWFTTDSATFVSVFFLLAGGLLWTYLFDTLFSSAKRENGSFRKSLFFFCYISSSVWMEDIYFSSVAVQYMTGQFLCPVVIILLIKTLFALNFHQKKMMLIKMADLITLTFIAAFICALYLPLFLLFVLGLCCTLFLVIKKNIHEKEASKRFFFFIPLYSVFVILFWLLISKMFQIICGIPGNYHYYTDQISTDIWERIKIVVYYVYNLMFKIHLNDSFPSCILYLPSILIFLASIIKQNAPHCNFYLIFDGCCIIAIPLIFPLLGNCGIREAVALPLVTAFVLTYAGEVIPWKRVKNIFFIFGLYLCFMNGWKISSIMTVDKVRYDKDLLLAEEIGGAITELGVYEEVECPFVLFVSNLKYDYGFLNVHGEYEGVSLFNKANYDVFTDTSGYAIPFMCSQGFRMQPISQENVNYKKMMSIAKHMACFPSEGSVVLFDDKETVIIKLGNSDFSSN